MLAQIFTCDPFVPTWTDHDTGRITSRRSRRVAHNLFFSKYKSLYQKNLGASPKTTGAPLSQILHLPLITLRNAFQLDENSSGFFGKVECIDLTIDFFTDLLFFFFFFFTTMPCLVAFNTVEDFLIFSNVFPPFFFLQSGLRPMLFSFIAMSV